MKTSNKLACIAALTALISISGLAGALELPEKQPSTGVLPIVEGVGSLTVSGGGYWHKDIYEDGEQPHLSAYDTSGRVLSDGFYRYEFRSSPQEAAETGESAFSLSNSKQQQGETVRGQFEIVGGQMVFK
jgi:hypothetical protein